MNRKDVRKLLLAARECERNQVDPDLVSGWDYAKLSNVAAYCADSGLIEAIEVTNFQSPHREFIVSNATPAGEDLLRVSGVLRRMFKGSKAIVATVMGILAIGSAIVTIAGSDRAQQAIKWAIYRLIR